MVLRGFKHVSVIASIIFTCCLALIGILLSSKVELSITAPLTAQAEKQIVLENDTVNNTTALTKKENVTSLKPQKFQTFVEISKAFREAIPQNSGYWNRKQHSFFQQLNSLKGREGNTFKWEEPAQNKVNIRDLNRYPQLFQDFLKGMHCRDPPILIDQPNKCPGMEGEGQPSLLFAIKSSPRNFEQRQAVRKTWGRERIYDGGLKVRTVFLLGTFSSVDPEMEELVHFEASRNGDILQWDFRDTFLNLTLKDNAFMGWVLLRCPGASFIFKGDDDVFVNQQAMVNYLRSLEPKKASSLYVGQIVSNASPIRDRTSKYYIPNSFYVGAYPSYAGGGGFLFSGSLVSPLYQVSQHIALFPIDDVYTGMCFQALGITPIPHPGFQTFGIKRQDRKNVCMHKNLILVHQRTPEELLRLWRHMLHPSLLKC